MKAESQGKPSTVIHRWFRVGQKICLIKNTISAILLYLVYLVYRLNSILDACFM